MKLQGPLSKYQEFQDNDKAFMKHGDPSKELALVEAYGVLEELTWTRGI